jgi:hypothetical protein
MTFLHYDDGWMRCATNERFWKGSELAILI